MTFLNVGVYYPMDQFRFIDRGLFESDFAADSLTPQILLSQLNRFSRQHQNGLYRARFPLCHICTRKRHHRARANNNRLVAQTATLSRVRREKRPQIRRILCHIVYGLVSLCAFFELHPLRVDGASYTFEQDKRLIPRETIRCGMHKRTSPRRATRPSPRRTRTHKRV